MTHVAGHIDGVNDELYPVAGAGDTSDPYQYGRPTWLPDADLYRTPAEEWQAFTTPQLPFWSTRVPMADYGQRLRARYALGAPAMAERTDPTFRGFLSDYANVDSTGGGYTWADDPTLRTRALLASQAATQAPGDYLTGTPGTADWNQRAWYLANFGGTSEEAAQNQMRVANLLALQRGGTAGGQHQGAMANAIRAANEAMYRSRFAEGAPRESFLNWYVQQMNPAEES